MGYGIYLLENFRGRDSFKLIGFVEKLELPGLMKQPEPNKKNNMITDTKKLTVAKEILSWNPECALSGSLGLEVQGFRVRRPVGDIDIFVPYGKVIRTFNMKESNNNDIEHSDDESDYERQSFYYNGCKIDFFTPIDDEVPNFVNIIKDGVKLVHFSDIIKMKILYSYGKSCGKFKHKDDIIFLLSQIS